MRREGREAATRRDSGLETNGSRLKTVTNPRENRQGPMLDRGTDVGTTAKDRDEISSRQLSRRGSASEIGPNLRHPL